MLKYNTVVGNCIEYDGIKVASYAKGLLCAIIAVKTNGDYEEEEVLTVNIAGGIDIGNGSVPGKYLAFLDTNNSPSAERFFLSKYPGKDTYQFRKEMIRLWLYTVWLKEATASRSGETPLCCCPTQPKSSP